VSINDDGVSGIRVGELGQVQAPETDLDFSI
jgi:hypothetical protein